MKTKHIVLSEGEAHPFKKIAGVTGFPIESIRLNPTGMGFYSVYFYDEKTEFTVNVFPTLAKR